MSLISLSLLKQALLINHSAQDDYIQFLCDGSEAFFAKELNLFFPADDDSAVVTEDLSAGDLSEANRWNWHQWNYCDEFLLPTKRPINALTSVVDLISDATLACIVDGDRIIRQLVSGGNGIAFSPGVKRYRVTYNAGYTPANVPAAIKQAIVMMTARAYEARAGESGGTAAGEIKTFAPLAQSDIMALVRPFSRKNMVSV